MNLSKCAPVASSRNVWDSESPFFFFFLPPKRSNTKNASRSTVAGSQATGSSEGAPSSGAGHNENSLWLMNPRAVCGPVCPQACRFSLSLCFEFVFSVAGRASSEMPEFNLLEQKPHQKAGHVTVPRPQPHIRTLGLEWKS